MKAVLEVVRLSNDIITSSLTPCLGQCGSADNAGSAGGCDGDE